MKERPVLFSGPMVRAILDGRKTQTRRVVKHRFPVWVMHEHWLAGHPHGGEFEGNWPMVTTDGGPAPIRCPCGVPGDRLWVRETHQPHPEAGVDYPGGCVPSNTTVYAADLSPEDRRESGPWRPSIHMPRWASRILLEVTEVRVERVQEISAADAHREGRPPWHLGSSEPLIQACKDAEADNWAIARAAGFSQQEIEDGESGHTLSVYWFRRLWDSINAKRGYGWDVNPWVWVVGFRVLERGE